MSDTYQEYFATVECLAKEASEAEDPEEYIHEACDGNYWVIYTHAALATIRHSSNWLAIDEYADDCGEPVSGDGLCSIITQAAYHALAADVREAMPERDDDDGS